MRPGAGTDVTVNSALAVATKRLDGFEPVGNRSPVRLQREVGAAGLQLQQGGKVLVTQSPPDEADDDLVDDGRNRKGHIELAGGFQPKFEVLAYQVAGQGGREIEVDEGRRLVATAGGPHHA